MVRKAGRFGALQELNQKKCGKVVHKAARSSFRVKTQPSGSRGGLGLPLPTLAPWAMEGSFWTSQNGKGRGFSSAALKLFGADQLASAVAFGASSIGISPPSGS